MKYSDSTIILPVLNEVQSIEKIVGLILKKYPGARLIIVDDGSTDGTIPAIMKLQSKKKNIIFLNRAKKTLKGITISVIEATQQCRTKYFVVIDADLQHPPEKISEIISKLRKGSNIVVGTRNKALYNWELGRRLMSATATFLARSKLDLKITDPLSGFFGSETAIFNETVKENRHRFVPEGYKVLFDYLKCVKTEKVAEVRYDFGARYGGKSKIGLKHVLKFLSSCAK